MNPVTGESQKSHTAIPNKVFLVLTLFAFALTSCSTDSNPVSSDNPDATPLQAGKTSNRLMAAAAFGYEIGYSNTQGTADATGRIGFPGLFSPENVLRAGPKVVVQMESSYNRTVQQAIQDQINYANQNRKRPQFIYWMLGLREQNVPGASTVQKQEALGILKAISRTVGNIPILINPMSDYTDHVCDGSGPFGPDVALELVDYLESVAPPGRLIRIARFEPLAQADTKDGCHPLDAIYDRDAQVLVDEIDRVLGL